MKLLKVAIRSITKRVGARRLTTTVAGTYRGSEDSHGFVPNASDVTRFSISGSWYKGSEVRVKRPFQRFIGIDLGGGRGKTTAVAEVRIGVAGAEVIEVATRSNKLAWTDETLVHRLATNDPHVAIAI